MFDLVARNEGMKADWRWIVASDGGIFLYMQPQHIRKFELSAASLPIESQFKQLLAKADKIYGVAQC